MASVEDIFAAMPGEFNADKAEAFDATIQFDLSGDSGGQWYVTIADGNMAVEKGDADDPTATIRMAAQDFEKMMTGKLDPMNAFMTGKVKVEGDLGSVMKFQSMFD